MWETEIRQAAATYLVPETWVRAVIEVESAWDPTAYRAEPQINDASYGLMQLLGKTARGLGFTGALDELYNPAVNINLGTKLLGQLRRSYGDDFRRVYSAYNSGKPDLWQTSTQVATHVGRALTALEKWVSSEISDITASPSSSGIVLLIGFVLLWAWGGKRPRK